jgi:hypothetical protein
MAGGVTAGINPALTRCFVLSNQLPCTVMCTFVARRKIPN